MYYPNFKEFKKKARNGNLIPVYREIVADMDTPVSAFLKIAENSSYSFLLESVEGGENIARYSFLGSNPFIIFKSKGNLITIEEKGKEINKQTDNPLKELKKLVSKFNPVKIEGLPRFFGGAVGYLSYDIVRFFEKLPDSSFDDLKLPEAFFLFTDSILIFDHLLHKIKVVSNAVVKGNPEESYEKAIKKIESLIKKLNSPLIFKKTKTNKKETKIVKSNLTKREFQEIVKKAKKYIYAGDVVQVVLSQRFSLPVKVHPFNIYRALRSLNPSPYLYYLSFPELKLIGSSPELLVRLEENLVETRPIAGTRPRGKNTEEDEKLQKELLADKKEKAEHIMLVDLGRNDIGRVCEYGTVKMNKLMDIEKYSHVMHIVSDITGKLKRGKDAFDVISKCFPAGTVSGAPKIRAMEIIEELEPTKRSVYAGCVGYFSFSGNMDTAITIRTIVVKDNIAHIQVGAGIVADSKPEKEYKETINKAKALIKAVEIAREGKL